MTWNWVSPSVVYAVHDKQLAEHGDCQVSAI